MIKFMPFKYPQEFPFVMLYLNEDLTSELLNYIETMSHDMYEHMSSTYVALSENPDCLLPEHEMESLKIFMNISGIKYEESDEVFEGP